MSRGGMEDGLKMEAGEKRRGRKGEEWIEDGRCKEDGRWREAEREEGRMDGRCQFQPEIINSGPAVVCSVWWGTGEVGTGPAVEYHELLGFIIAIQYRRTYIRSGIYFS
jgi:hypothetical protein